MDYLTVTYTRKHPMPNSPLCTVRQSSILCTSSLGILTWQIRLDHKSTQSSIYSLFRRVASSNLSSSISTLSKWHQKAPVSTYARNVSKSILSTWKVCKIVLSNINKSKTGDHLLAFFSLRVHLFLSFLLTNLRQDSFNQDFTIPVLEILKVQLRFSFLQVRRELSSNTSSKKEENRTPNPL